MIIAGYVCGLLYVPLLIFTLLYTRGASRWIAIATIPPAAFIAVITIHGYVIESNLWPLYMIFLSPIGTIVLLSCLLAEFLLRRTDPHRTETTAQRCRRLGLCERCGYDLQSNFDVGCPECGWNRAQSNE